jgi:uncharacterized protein VirK/YbjX
VLEDLCARVGVAAIPFELARKPTQSFLHRGLPESERGNLLKMHYAGLLTGIGDGFCHTLLSGGEIDLLTILGVGGASYGVRLERSKVNAREGELSVSLERTEDGLRVASLSVAIGAARPEDPAVLWIGGLQGCKAEGSKAITICATKALFGLRPKDLLMVVAYGLSERLNLREIRAISNDAHVHAGKSGKTWNADYDAFWIEQGGEAIPGGFFRLPPSKPRRKLEDVAPAKRKAWLKRQDLADRIREATLGLGKIAP